MFSEIVFHKNIFRLGYRVSLWHLKYIFYRKASPLACGFYLTSKCNFRCKFCNIWRINPGYQVSKNDAQKVIKELGKMGLIYFSFSGGEPLVVPYVFDLLAFAKECGILYTHVVSNGYLVDEKKARELASANVSEISFSIDGNEEIYDKQRGVDGAFKKIIDAVYNVQTYAPATKIILNTILDPTHPERALLAVEIAKKHGVKIKIQPLNDHPSFDLEEAAGKTMRHLTPDEKQALFNSMKILQKTPNVINSRPFLENYIAFLFSPDKLTFAKDNCIFGYHHVELFNNRVFPCLEGLNWDKGFDTAKKSIDEILSSREYSEKLQQLKTCLNCRKNFYVCYYEPRLNFPIWNLIKSRFPFMRTY